MILKTNKLLLNEVIDLLYDVCSEKFVFTDAESHWKYETDQTLDYRYPFDILVKPGTVEEISAIVKICNKFKIPLTPRGGGSGVTGGALPLNRGIVISLERLNKIIAINEIDSFVIAETGVITADLCHTVEKLGLYFPVLPSSGSYSFVGGNIAENAGSINSCKYGNTSKYVLNLEVVLPSGDIIWTGANVTKNVSGLNVTQLFVGSEGTLGIITKVVYQLIEKPKKDVSLLIGFNSLKNACLAVSALKRSVLIPSAVELICENAIKITAEYLNESLPLISPHIKAHLLINFHENNSKAIDDCIDLTSQLIQDLTDEEILVADSFHLKEKLWKLRFSIGMALTSENKRYRDIDLSIPMSAVFDYIMNLELISAKYKLEFACFGHVMDGNLHTMLIMDHDLMSEDQININNALQDIYSYAVNVGGTISGEHGIGFLQKEFIPLQFSSAHLNLMRSIKSIMDPNHIMNPGKIL